MMTIIGNEYTAHLVIFQLRKWDEALCTLDLKKILPFYETRSTYFDIGYEFESLKQYEDFWADFQVTQQLQPSKNFQILRRDLRVYADENMVTLHAFFKINYLMNTVLSEFGWCRQTMCWIKVENHWKILHQHISAAIDLDTGTLKKE